MRKRVYRKTVRGSIRCYCGLILTWEGLNVQRLRSPKTAQSLGKLFVEQSIGVHPLRYTSNDIFESTENRGNVEQFHFKNSIRRFRHVLSEKEIQTEKDSRFTNELFSHK